MKLKLTLLAALTLLGLSACSIKTSDKNLEEDLTSDFISKTSSGGSFNVGAPSPASGPSQVTIGPDGTQIVRYNDFDCPYMVYSKIQKVMRSDANHFTIWYRNTGVTLAMSNPSAKCQEALTKYNDYYLARVESRILCGYSADFVNFSCDGNRYSFANWIRP